MENKKYSVIMASYLGSYPKCATNREEKFIRSVNSFLSQTYKNTELIIVSDFCDKSEELYNKFFSQHENIKFIKTKYKLPLFSGDVRNLGLSIASGDRICYLDTDDFLTQTHIEEIDKGFDEDLFWVYYDDYLVDSIDNNGGLVLNVRENKLEETFIGTSSICHKMDSGLTWPNGYGHDWFFVKNMLHRPNKKITKGGYIVCHIPNLIDF